MTGQAKAIWFTGLPGCGKSSVARAVASRLRNMGHDPVHLEMDERRKSYTPNPQYTPEERGRAYRMFVDEARTLAAAGRTVLMDGTGHRLQWRALARRRLDGFAEVHLRCSLEAAMQREAERPQGKVQAQLYAKALERKNTGKEFPSLGVVPGVDEPFEEDPEAEVVIDTESARPETAAEIVVTRLFG